MTRGLTSERGISSPPYTQGSYKWDQGLSMENRLTNGTKRYVLTERFNHLPSTNANIGVATNLDFEVLGTNASADDVTFAATIGGLQLQTDGGENDSIIILPHLDSGQTAWTGVKWGTENQTIWEAIIRTDAITLCTIWAGLKLTNTATVATDDDQAFFRYAAASDTNWQAEYSIGGSDTEVDTGVVVEANTNYYFRIEIDADRKAHFYINEVQVASSTALTNDVDLIPYVGILANTNAPKTLNLSMEQISRIIYE